MTAVSSFSYTERNSTSSINSSLSTAVNFSFFCTNISTTTYRKDHSYFTHIYSYNYSIWKYNLVVKDNFKEYSKTIPIVYKHT